MLLYNVTSIIEESSADSWLQWMLNTHIPKVMATEMFVSYRLLKVLDSPNDGVTYCAQYVVENLENYNSYNDKFASELMKEAGNKFENQVVSFQTLMEYVP